MFHVNFTRMAIIAAVLGLGACAAQQQTVPAPVIASTENANNVNGNVYNPYSTATPVSSNVVTVTDTTTGVYNPYSSNVPYTPPSTSVNNTSAYQQPYQPVVTTAISSGVSGVNVNGQRVGNVNGVYVGNYAPVNIHASTHTVTAGDTIFNIAKRYGITQENLRAWNNLHDNAINLGQVLRVKAVGSSSNNSNKVNTSAQAKPAGATVNNNYVPPAVSNANIIWTTPTYGTIVRSFGGDNKGVDISGTRGQPVVAAADGQVVYSGSNLRGYGNLIILQHNPTYLTAYGHNDSLMVKEGMFVKRGQQIARMGSSDSSSGVKLHFEVRENGTPVNPNRFVKF